MLCVAACSGGGEKHASPTTTVVSTTTSTAPVERSGSARAGDDRPLTRPIITMAGCTLSSAHEGSGKISTLFAWPSSKRTVQVVADPVRGVDRPYAVVERFFANGEGRDMPGPPVDVNGQPATVYVGEYGQGAAKWTLADGSAGYIRARGFDRSGLVAIARALRPRTASLPIPGFDLARPAPFGLEVVDGTAGPLRGTGVGSTCTLANGVQVTVSVLRGDKMSRYASLMDHLPLPVVAEHGDAVVAIFSPDPAAAQRASRSVRNATTRQWAALLHR